MHGQERAYQNGEKEADGEREERQGMSLEVGKPV